MIHKEYEKEIEDVRCILVAMALCDSDDLYNEYTVNLNSDESNVLYLRFIQKMTLKRIGAVLNITSERVRQRVAKGMRKLAKPENNKILSMKLRLF